MPGRSPIAYVTTGNKHLWKINDLSFVLTMNLKGAGEDGNLLDANQCFALVGIGPTLASLYSETLEWSLSTRDQDPPWLTHVQLYHWHAVIIANQPLRKCGSFWSPHRPYCQRVTATNWLKVNSDGSWPPCPLWLLPVTWPRWIRARSALRAPTSTTTPPPVAAADAACPSEMSNPAPPFRKWTMSQTFSDDCVLTTCILGITFFFPFNYIWNWFNRVEHSEAAEMRRSLLGDRLFTLDSSVDDAVQLDISGFPDQCAGNWPRNFINLVTGFGITIFITSTATASTTCGASVTITNTYSIDGCSPYGLATCT